MAENEAVEFERVFSKKENPLEPGIKYVPFYEMDSAALLKEVNAAKSSSEAYRLIQQGAVTLDGQKIMNPKSRQRIKDGGSLLKVGKKFFVKILPKLSTEGKKG